MTELLSIFPLYQLVLLGVILIAFILQAVFWLRYRAVAAHRHPYRLKKGEPLPPVSVVVIVNEEFCYLENGLPELLSQEHPQFEVVVVNDCGGQEIDGQLEIMTRQYPHLRYTTFKKDDHFSHSRKIPLVVGLKACKYNNVIITHTDTVPAGKKWLSNMSKGFVGNKQLIIGYCGFEPEKGFANKYIRCSRLSISVRYLRAAVSGRAYRGIYNNIGYTKNLFFDNRGFTHLNMSIGEDDFFVQKVASRQNTAVVINHSATMRQKAGGGLGWWWREQRYRTYTFGNYPASVKTGIFTELFSRATFFASVVALSICSGMGGNLLWTAAVGLFLLRELILRAAIQKITKRVGEHKLTAAYIFYDLVSPLTEAALSISRRIKPPSGIWT